MTSALMPAATGWPLDVLGMIPSEEKVLSDPFRMIFHDTISDQFFLYDRLFAGLATNDANHESRIEIHAACELSSDETNFLIDQKELSSNNKTKTPTIDSILVKKPLRIYVFTGTRYGDYRCVQYWNWAAHMKWATHDGAFPTSVVADLTEKVIGDIRADHTIEFRNVIR